MQIDAATTIRYQGFFKSLLFGFTVDTLGGDRSCFEPLDGDVFSTGFADTKGPVFNSLQRLFLLF